MANFEKYWKEFNQLFEELSGIHPDQALKGEDGFLFIPPEAKLGEKDSKKRRRITELAGANGWRNHIVNDEYAGWWIRPAIHNNELITQSGEQDFLNSLTEKLI